MSVHVLCFHCDSTVNLTVHPFNIAPTAWRLSFAINNAAASLGCHFMPPFEDRDLDSLIEKMGPLGPYHYRATFLEAVVGLFGSPSGLSSEQIAGKIAQAVAREFKPYAKFVNRWAAKNMVGYRNCRHPAQLPKLEKFVLDPGTLDSATRWDNLRGQCRPHKPWLNKLPRLIAINSGSAFESCERNQIARELIDAVGSPGGRRHIWLLRTDTPDCVAAFSEWLEYDRQAAWPNNLVPVIKVDSNNADRELPKLRKIKSPVRAVYVDSLRFKKSWDLQGIDWVILGTENVRHRWKHYDLESAYDLSEQCRKAQVAFFVEHLGLPSLECSSHAWPSEMRIRQIPAWFRQYGMKNTALVGA